MSSLNEPLGSADEDCDGEFLDLLASDGEDPATAAARSLDWNEFLLGCNTRERSVASTIAEGGELQRVAAQCGASRSAISSDKHCIAAKLKEQWGSNILAHIAVAPAWQNSITAVHQKRAARAMGVGR